MIDLIDVSKSYGPGLPAVNHANLHIDKGEFVFVVGNSGSGKTTLIKLLMKELDSTSGQIIVSGKAFRARIVQLFRVDVVCRDHFQRVQLTGFVQVKVSHVTETDNSSFHPQNSSSY